MTLGGDARWGQLRAVSTTIAFLGSGRLASAIIRGLIQRGGMSPQNIRCTSKHGESARALAEELGVVFEPDLEALLAPADVVVLAFKPQSLASADQRLATLTRGKLVISLLAGKRLSLLASILPGAQNIVRTMPNTPAAVGAGITPYCSLVTLNSDEECVVGSILRPLGSFLPLEEQHMDAVTALSAGGPAFLFEHLCALRDGGIAVGLPAETATLLAIETFIGAARLLAESKKSPESLRDEVVSPNGTTAAGLAELSHAAFRQTVANSIAKATARATELSGA